MNIKYILLKITFLVWVFTNSNKICGQIKKLESGPPVVRIDEAFKLTNSITIIPDPRINYIPNIGIIEGKNAILVVDTGMGPKNAEAVYKKALEISKGRKIYITTTHFHPEHNFGASVFKKSGATIIMNRLQVNELERKGTQYLEMFRSFGELEKTSLLGTELVTADDIYSGIKILDLGNKEVILYEMPGHTSGDQVIFVKDDSVVFMGDLVEERFFPIMPDKDTQPSKWINVLIKVKKLKPNIIVPGHGDIGDIQLLEDVLEYLLMAKKEVKKQIALGKSEKSIVDYLKNKLAASRPTWDNKVFIPYQIAHFIAELKGSKEVKLPDLTKDLEEK